MKILFKQRWFGLFLGKRGSYVVILVGVVMFELLAFSASSYAEVSNKSKLMALINMKIPPAVPGMKRGKLLGWISSGGIGLSPNDPALLFLDVDEGFIGNEGGVILVSVDEDRTSTVLDARELPLGLLRYELKDGKRISRKDAFKQYSIQRCDKTGTTDLIVGLMRPEPGKEGCLHNSRIVKMAWRVNAKARHLEDISPDGVVCFFPDAEDECNN